MNKATILLVEDEERLRRVVSLQLESAGHTVVEASSAEQAITLTPRADLIITDLRLPGIDGLQFLASLRRQNTQTPVIVMTAFSTVETAVDAMKSGAFDFLPKPFSMDHLMTVVQKALEVGALREENRALREQLNAHLEDGGFVAEAPPMREILATIDRIAPTRSTVLLTGESGVGKDMLARAIHNRSPRRDRPFVKINCAAMPENLIESELFGYEKGAFTGAAASKPGKFEQADGGTVFLDEIGEVPLGTQVKLLRILQDRELERLGSNKTRQVDVRVIAATNADLRRGLNEGTFREDLFYRLNVLPISIPPLRDRREDIPELARRFVAKFSRELGASVDSISPEALEHLRQYNWPGNVRQLQNVIERSILLCPGSRIEPTDIRLDLSPRTAPKLEASFFPPEGMTLDEFEQAILREALRRAGGNKSQAARLLGLTRNALRYRLTQMGIEA